MPGIGPWTGTRILAGVGDGSAFAKGRKLAAYAGLAPITRQSGTSLNPRPGILSLLRPQTRRG